jgi:transposase-like protein
VARTYSDDDRARAYVYLTANEGNLKRTARETNIPISTLRQWRDGWVADGPPDTAEVVIIAGEFVADAERVRNKALIEMERKIPDATPSALVAMVGMLTDKLNIAQGLATSRNETVHKLPSGEEIKAILGPVLQKALAAASTRDDEIQDAEFVPLDNPALPAAQ